MKKQRVSNKNQSPLIRKCVLCNSISPGKSHRFFRLQGWEAQLENHYLRAVFLFKLLKVPFFPSYFFRVRAFSFFFDISFQTWPKQTFTNRLTDLFVQISRITSSEMRDLRLASPGGHSTQRLISPIGHLWVSSLNDHRVSSPSDSEIRVHSPSKFVTPLLLRLHNLPFRPILFPSVSTAILPSTGRPRKAINRPRQNFLRWGIRLYERTRTLTAQSKLFKAQLIYC